MISSSKELLELECTNNGTSSTSSSLESKLTVCKQNQLLHSKKEVLKPEKKPDFSSLPKSQFLGKVKDFLGVISEANEKLQLDAKDNSEKYDIEVLNGNDSEYIEMDLMLGVADLETPEAVAAAEGAIAGHEAIINIKGGSDSSSSESESDDSSDDSDDETEVVTPGKRHKPAAEEDDPSLKKNQSCKKRPKIIELP